MASDMQSSESSFWLEETTNEAEELVRTVVISAEESYHRLESTFVLASDDEGEAGTAAAAAEENGDQQPPPSPPSDSDHGYSDDDYDSRSSSRTRSRSRSRSSRSRSVSRSPSRSVSRSISPVGSGRSDGDGYSDDSYESSSFEHRSSSSRGSSRRSATHRRTSDPELANEKAATTTTATSPTNKPPGDEEKEPSGQPTDEDDRSSSSTGGVRSPQRRRMRKPGLLRLAKPTEVKTVCQVRGEEGVIAAQRQFFKAVGMASPLLAFYGKSRRRPAHEVADYKARERNRSAPRRSAGLDGSTSGPNVSTIDNDGGVETESLSASKKRERLPPAASVPLKQVPIHGGGYIKRQPIVSPAIREHERYLKKLFQKDPVAYFREVGTTVSTVMSDRTKDAIDKCKETPSKMPSNFAGTAPRQQMYTTDGPGPAYVLPSACFDLTNGTKKMGPKPQAKSGVQLRREITPSVCDYNVETHWNYNQRTRFPDQHFTRARRWVDHRPMRLDEIGLSKQGEAKFRKGMRELGLSTTEPRRGGGGGGSRKGEKEKGIAPYYPAGPSSLKDWNEE